MNEPQEPVTRTPGGRRRIFIVDDHPVVRQGLALLINQQKDLMVCGEAEDSQSALVALDTLAPDLLTVDISINGPDGLDLVKAIRVRTAVLPVLVISMHDEAIYAERALRAGANGYIMKQEATDRVVTAIRRLLQGDVYLSRRAAGRMVQQFVHGATTKAQPALALLSDRELEVFRLVGEGHSTRHIASGLHLSVKTVESHQAHIKEKLSLRNARELVHYAIEWHLTDRSGTGAP